MPIPSTSVLHQMLEQDRVNYFWFRRDLRLVDNAGLYHALKAGLSVVPLFIFDTNILDDLEDRSDKRVIFIYESLRSLNERLEKIGSSLLVEHGKPVEVWARLSTEQHVHTVFANRDYEPYAKERDAETGLDFFGARYMSSAQGRFTSPDPLMGSAQLSNPQTWNRYSYGLELQFGLKLVL